MSHGYLNSQEKVRILLGAPKMVKMRTLNWRSSYEQIERPPRHTDLRASVRGTIESMIAHGYLPQTNPGHVPHGGKWLAQGPATVVEGSWPGAVVLMEFPSREAAETWYKSEEYQAILPLRLKNSISDIIMIDQLPAGFTIKGFAQEVRRAASAGPSSAG